MSSFLKSKAPRRPPVVKMPDSAFFEDKRDRAVGQTSRWRPLWIVSAALLVLVVSAYFAYSNLWLLAVGGVPDAALAAAREANTTIPDPETTMAYRTPSGYRVLFLGSSVIGGWRPSVTVQLTRSSSVVKVIVLYGDPRPLQMLSLAGGAVGTAVSLAVLWGKRREIISRLRPRRKWIWSN